MMLEAFVEKFFYPLWDIKDRSSRLRELADLFRSEWWDRNRIAALQLARADEIAKYAWDNTDYYRTHWCERPEITSLESMTELPITTKADIRGAGEGILSNAIPISEMITARTGGSTGIALKVRYDVVCGQRRNAAALRSNGWAGWRPGMWVGALWGTPPVPGTLKEKLRNRFHDRLQYLDTMHLNAETMGAFIDRLNRINAKILFGHAHSLYLLARFIDDSGQKLNSIVGIVSTSMKLLDHERRAIESAMNCAVTDRYGCEETGLIAAQCEVHEGLHVNSEHVHVEVLDDSDNPVRPGEIGRLVVTDLINRAMPLIRYDIGDMAAWSETDCKCGRKHRTIARVVGRTADSLVKEDGSRVAGISLVEKTLTDIAGLEQLQIVQEEVQVFELHVVCDPVSSVYVRRDLTRVMHEVFGMSAVVHINEVKSLQQDQNGKYRFAICKTEAHM